MHGWLDEQQKKLISALVQVENEAEAKLGKDVKDYSIRDVKL